MFVAAYAHTFPFYATCIVGKYIELDTHAFPQNLEISESIWGAASQPRKNIPPPRPAFLKCFAMWGRGAAKEREDFQKLKVGEGEIGVRATL